MVQCIWFGLKAFTDLSEAKKPRRLSPVISPVSLCYVTLWLCVQVRSLESANRKLELQIREFYEKRAPTVAKDFNAYFATISDLRAQVPLTFYTS